MGWSGGCGDAEWADRLRRRSLVSWMGLRADRGDHIMSILSVLIGMTVAVGLRVAIAVAMSDRGRRREGFKWAMNRSCHLRCERLHRCWRWRDCENG